MRVLGVFAFFIVVTFAPGQACSGDECAAQKQKAPTSGNALIQTKRAVTLEQAKHVFQMDRGITQQTACQKVCATSKKSWTTKCKWKRCKGCSACSACPESCAMKRKSWTTKCKWNKCKRCGECSTTERISPAPTQAVTLAPTPRATPSPTPPHQLKCANWCKGAGSTWHSKCNWGDLVCSECDECVYEPAFAPKWPALATHEFPDARHFPYANWQCEKICAARSELVEGKIGRGCCEWTPGGECKFYPNGAIDKRSTGDGTVWNCEQHLAGIGKCSGWTDGKKCNGGDAENAVQFVQAQGSTSYLMQTNNKLVLDWSDEFDNCPEGLPDPSIWTFEDGAREERLQWYTEKNAKCIDGKLVIEAREETPMEVGYGPWEWRKGGANRVYAAQHKYTSSSITSQGKKSFLLGGRGKAELRARVDVRSGAFPAWWSMGEPDDFNPPCQWPGCGEIDMMEYVGETGWMKTNFCHATGGDAECKWGTGCHCKWHYSIKAVNETWSKDFHTWAMEWDESEDIIQVTLDGALLVGQTFSEADPVNTGRPENPFRGKRNYMILNLALGFVGGDPTPTQFPMKFEIDYLRIYKEI